MVWRELLCHSEVKGVLHFSSLSTSCSLPRLERVPYQASFSYNMVAHSEIFLSKCALFREQGEFIDVRLKVGEDEFPAHRIVLAANSDYFHAMFANGMKETNQELIELKDKNISNSAFKIVMDSMYSGEINVNDENVFEVLLAADPRGGDSHMKQTGMLVGNFQFHPQRRPIWAWFKEILTLKETA